MQKNTLDKNLWLPSISSLEKGPTVCFYMFGDLLLGLGFIVLILGVFLHFYFLLFLYEMQGNASKMLQ